MIKTRIAKVDGQYLDREVLAEAGKILKAGGLVAFPTETVYGLGGDALQRESARKIYAAKGRPSDNPLIVHICRWEDIGKITRKIPEEAQKLARAFWPGPLTMILEKSDAVPTETTGGLSTVAVRMPDNRVALALIEAAGGYVAAPSANLSGKPSPTMAGHVAEDLSGRIEMVLDGGAACIGLESTIVDLTEGTPVILRPGCITKDMLEAVLNGPVDEDRPSVGMEEGRAPKAPGMKYRHYAPAGELTVVTGEEQEVTKTIQRLADEKMRAGEKVGILCSSETQGFYQADWVEAAGAREDEAEAARHLYAILRSFDRQHVTCIYSEAFSGDGIGQAVMNRLLKAAGYHIIKTGENRRESE